MLTIIIEDNHQVIFESGHQKMQNFPDEAIVLLHREPPVSWLMVANDDTQLMEGDTIETSKKRKKEVLLKSNDTNEFDCHYAGISGVYTDFENELWGLYHAERFTMKNETEIKYRDWAIGLAKWNKETESFDKEGLALQTRERHNEDPHHGIGDPSVCKNIMNHSEWYAYYTDLTRVNGKCVISMAKCDHKSPEKWYKRSGPNDFEVPGDRHESPLVELFKEPLENCDVSHPNVQYIEEWNMYIMVLRLLALEELENGTDRLANPQRSGFYISCSSCGLQWSNPDLLFSANVQDNGYHVVMRPSFIVEEPGSYAVSGKLYYAYSELRDEPNRITHYLVRKGLQVTRPFELF